MRYACVLWVNANAQNASNLLNTCVHLPPHPLPAKLHDQRRNDAYSHDQRDSDSCARRKANIGEHIREPERADEAPDLPNKRDEDANATSLVRIAVNRIRDQHRGNNLIPRRRDPRPNHRRHIPMQIRRLLNPHQKHHHPDNRQRISQITQPQPELGCRFRRRSLLPLPPHPEITRIPADLLADDRADDDAEELQAELLAVEVEFLAEELRDLDGDEDGGEEEDHCVRAGGDHDARVLCHSEGRDELEEGEGRWVDAVEFEVFFFEGRAVVVDAEAEVACFWAEEDVEDELTAIDLRIVLVDTTMVGCGIRVG